MSLLRMMFVVGLSHMAFIMWRYVPYGFPSDHVQLRQKEHKEVKCQRADAFDLWCRRRLLRAPWTARRSNQPGLREINPENLLEGLMLKLKCQYFGYLMQTLWKLSWLTGKVPDAGKDESRRRRGRQRMRWPDGTDEMDMNLGKL